MANKRPRTDRPAVVLLMGLLFMAAITASTIGISVVINSSLQQSHNVDDFILASLAADTGLERGLAVIAAGRSQSSLTLDSAIPCASTSGICSNRGPLPTMSNGSTLNVRSFESLDPVAKKTLTENQSIDFDLFDLSGVSAITPLALRVTGTCSEPSACNNLLEVSWTVLSSSGSSAFSNREYLTESTYEASSKCIVLTNVRTESDDTAGAFTGSLLGFRIKIRALRGSVENVNAKAYGDPTCTSLAPILSRVKLESSGEAGGLNNRVQSIKQATVLWQLPASGAFNYVVFSEESIVP